MSNRRAFITGISGPALTAEEREFVRDFRPWGFILFKRNAENPAQVVRLVDELRETVGDAEAPVLIDQEGGRVQRLRPPHWPLYPSGRSAGRRFTTSTFARASCGAAERAADRSRPERSRRDR